MEADDVMELALDAFEIFMPETLDKIHKLFVLVMKTYDKYQEQKANDAFIDTIAGIEVKALARDMARLCQHFQADTPLFPLDYRKRFLKVFLTQNPDVHPTPKLYIDFNKCFDRLEAVIQEKYSAGERAILRQETLTQNMIGDVSSNVQDMRNAAQNTNDIVQDIQVKVNQMVNPPAIPTLHTSNDNYSKWFQKPLFRHAGRNDKVNLSNLFVKHKFEVMHGSSAKTTVDEYLAEFLRDNETSFLFIEGDAGCGKTGLTQYMSYHYEQHDKIARQIFGSKRLITIRLREINQIPTDCRPELCLRFAILRFLYRNRNDDDNLEHFRKSGPRLLWLDGYDELCTMEAIKTPEEVLWPLKKLGCKIIITSRPYYIRFDYSKPYWRIVLQHFKKDQRQEWMEHYEIQCGETLEALNRQYLEGADDTGICNTPMGLYMVAAGHFKESQLRNEWALYYQIFHEEIKNTPYNKL